MANEQVLLQLRGEINLAYAAITRIHEIAVKARNAIQEVINAGNAIQEEESFDRCVDIAETAITDIDIGNIIGTRVLAIPFYTLQRIKRIHPNMISSNLSEKLNRDTTLSGIEINKLLKVILDTRDKAEMNAAFTKLTDGVMQMEDTWRIIHDYAKPVPQEAPRKERTRGGRKRTHRNYRRRTHRRRTHRK